MQEVVIENADHAMGDELLKKTGAGNEVVGRLRASSKRERSSTPIIAVTANALKGDAEKALKAGRDAYVEACKSTRTMGTG